METKEDFIRRLLLESDACKNAVELMLNCQFDEATKIFAETKNDNPCSAAGYCLTKVLRFVTSFEEDHKRQALEAVKEVEHDCIHEQGQFRKGLKLLTKDDIYRQLSCYHLEVVCADCYLYQAIAVMMNMDVAGYVKGGWFVRKAWKLYEKLHKEIEKLMQTYSVRLDTDTKSVDADNVEDFIRDLFCTVSFGYGLFNLFLSILSPQILKLISFFGFSSSRRTGLDSLDLVSRSRVMRSPLATLTLLWFHTVARSFLALDGTQVNAGVVEAEQLLNRQNDKLTNTMLFVFFKGRIKRLQSNIPSAIILYDEALNAAGHQAELQQMCQYELGWCRLHLLQWSEAGCYFKTLQEHSKWLPSYYCYLAGLCAGASEDIEASRALMGLVGKLTKRKNNPIESFVLYRAKKLASNDYELNKRHSILFIGEIMFFWRALGNVSTNELEKLLIELNKTIEKKLVPLKCLLEGAIYAVLDKSELAVQFLEECIARADRIKEEKHWAAFASFELAYILMRNKNTRDRSKALLINIRDKMKGYFFENRLHLRLNAALKMVDKLEQNERTL